MPRKRNPESEREASIKLPEWWLDELRRLVGGTTQATIASQLRPLLPNRPTLDASYVSAFLRGERTPLSIMEAFLELFPELPRPILYATNLEQARVLTLLARQLDQRRTPVPEPRRRDEPEHPLKDTIEDTGEQPVRKSKQR